MPEAGRGAPCPPGGGGISPSSQLPPVSRSPLPRTRPSTTTLPASATSAAAVRESPKSRESAWSTRWPSSPSGTGRARCRPAELITAPIVTAAPDGAPQAGPSGGVGAAAGLGPGTRPGPVELDAAHRKQHPQDPAAHDRGVSDVEHRPDPAVGREDGNEVHDAAAQEA